MFCSVPYLVNKFLHVDDVIRLTLLTVADVDFGGGRKSLALTEDRHGDVAHAARPVGVDKHVGRLEVPMTAHGRPVQIAHTLETGRGGQMHVMVNSLR